MILDIPRKLYDEKIVGNAEALKAYNRGERTFCFYGVRWIGPNASGKTLRRLIGL